MNIFLKILFCLLLILNSSIPLAYSLEKYSEGDILLVRSELKKILNEKNLNSVDSCSEVLSKLFNSFLQNKTPKIS
jgi:hypothetical protein